MNTTVQQLIELDLQRFLQPRTFRRRQNLITLKEEEEKEERIMLQLKHVYG